jgi:hypothetical protein
MALPLAAGFESASPCSPRRGQRHYFFSSECFLNAVNILPPDSLVKHDTPSMLQLTLTQQASRGRWILHFLHFIPERRSDSLDVIEDVISLFKVKVGVKAAASIREVIMVPEEALLNIRAEEAFTVLESRTNRRPRDGKPDFWLKL